MAAGTGASPWADPGFAPAKINLALHVTGRRGDGYHLLDSLVVFAGCGDSVAASPSGSLDLTIDGPMAAGLETGEGNLVLRAARWLDAGAGRGADLRLTKRLPVASGIGGGSADAAAAVRVLAALWGVAVPEARAAAELGADVPVCLARQPSRMRGTGEVLTPVPLLPEAHVLLVNPRRAVATPAIFAALASRENPGLPELPAAFADAAALAQYLRACRNDLQPAAEGIEPAVSEVLAAIGVQAGCLLARMSGSGATCFGLFATAAGADRARAVIAAERPGWWVVSAPVLGEGD